MGAHTAVGLTWQADAALELHAHNRVGEAQLLATEQLDRARALDQPRPLGVALRTMGTVTDGRAGLALLTESVAVLAGSTARLEHARALVEQGARLAALGQETESKTALRAGYEQARLCGATALAARAAASLAAAGVRLRRPQLSGRDALTASELRVAEMAAEGLSNPEIAQALFVSRKTIEMHLGNVYRKLVVPGRQQLSDALAKPLPRPGRG
jgi:DNA-binding CsgD family transcriptional regulator